MSQDKGKKIYRQDTWSSSNYTDNDERLDDEEWEEMQKGDRHSNSSNRRS